MTVKMEKVINRENDYFCLRGGQILEADEQWNNIQREKIAAVYEYNSKAYIGKINFYGDERNNLTENMVFKEYTGQKVYNFGADFIVPVADGKLAEMIVQWNSEIQSLKANLIKSIFNRIDKIGGLNLTWS